jgi:acetate kinase
VGVLWGVLVSSIAVINAGSSSIKFAVFQAASSPSLLLRGQIEGIGTAPRARLSDPGGTLLVEESFDDNNFDHVAATQAMKP